MTLSHSGEKLSRELECSDEVYLTLSATYSSSPITCHISRTQIHNLLHQVKERGAHFNSIRRRTTRRGNELSRALEESEQRKVPVLDGGLFDPQNNFFTHD